MCDGGAVFTHISRAARGFHWDLPAGFLVDEYQVAQIGAVMFPSIEL
jgi:hypothetical protein